MLKFYRCSICGNLIEVIDDSGVVPVCCGKTMELLVPQTNDQAREKHVPVITECTKPAEVCKDSEAGRVVTVQVGELPHPMTDVHLILWITLITDQGVYRKVTISLEKAEVKFNLQACEEIMAIYAYCNIHGLWVKVFE